MITCNSAFGKCHIVFYQLLVDVGRKPNEKKNVGLSFYLNV